MKKLMFRLIISFLVTMVLASCKGNAGSNKIEVAMDDFSFTPEEFTISAGKEITVSITNSGKEAHEFVIFKQGLNAGDTFGDEDEANILWEIEAEPGATNTGTFTAPTQKGVYYVTCGIEDHLGKGMVAYVIVVE